MKHLEAEDRTLNAPPYIPSEVDAEFIPYLELINAMPFAATVQCCAGHLNYPKGQSPHGGNRGKWGYIQLLMTLPSACWLVQELINERWLLMAMSKLWNHGAREMPSHTDFMNFMVTFAWDSASWPAPARRICELLGRYRAEEPAEPPHLLLVDRTEPIAPFDIRTRKQMGTRGRRPKR